MLMEATAEGLCSPASFASLPASVFPVRYEAWPPCEVGGPSGCASRQSRSKHEGCRVGRNLEHNLCQSSAPDLAPSRKSASWIVAIS